MYSKSGSITESVDTPDPSLYSNKIFIGRESQRFYFVFRYLKRIFIQALFLSDFSSSSTFFEYTSCLYGIGV